MTVAMHGSTFCTKLLFPFRDGPLMIGGLRQRIRVEFFFFAANRLMMFFPGQPADESFFFFQVVELSFLFINGPSLTLFHKAMSVIPISIHVYN